MNNYYSGLIVNALRIGGDIHADELKKISLMYHVLHIVGADKFENMLYALNDEVEIYGKMEPSFCSEKTNLLYADCTDEMHSVVKSVIHEMDITFSYFDERMYRRIEEIKTEIKLQAPEELRASVWSEACEWERSNLTNTNIWKAGECIQRIYRFLTPWRKRAN